MEGASLETLLALASLFAALVGVLTAIVAIPGVLRGALMTPLKYLGVLAGVLGLRTLLEVVRTFSAVEVEVRSSTTSVSFPHDIALVDGGIASVVAVFLLGFTVQIFQLSKTRGM